MRTAEERLARAIALHLHRGNGVVARSLHRLARSVGVRIVDSGSPVPAGEAEVRCTLCRRRLMNVVWIQRLPYGTVCAEKLKES